MKSPFISVKKIKEIVKSITLHQPHPIVVPLSGYVCIWNNVIYVPKHKDTRKKKKVATEAEVTAGSNLARKKKKKHKSRLLFLE